MESKKRSLLKTISYRILGSLFTFFISLILTFDLISSTSISVLDLIAKTLLYYIHERAWDKIR